MSTKTAKKEDWQTCQMPSEQRTIVVTRTFSRTEMQRIQAGLIPQQMEDKWFIYWHDDSLFFHRSWTGYCIYVVRFAVDGNSYRMIEVALNRNSEQYGQTNDDYDAKMVNYLIDVLLLDKASDFPSEEPGSDKQVLMQWSHIGRAMLGQHPPRTE